MSWFDCTKSKPQYNTDQIVERLHDLQRREMIFTEDIIELKVKQGHLYRIMAGYTRKVSDPKIDSIHSSIKKQEQCISAVIESRQKIMYDIIKLINRVESIEDAQNEFEKRLSLIEKTKTEVTINIQKELLPMTVEKS